MFRLQLDKLLFTDVVDFVLGVQGIPGFSGGVRALCLDLNWLNCFLLTLWAFVLGAQGTPGFSGGV